MSCLNIASFVAINSKSLSVSLAIYVGTCSGKSIFKTPQSQYQYEYSISTLYCTIAFSENMSCTTLTCSLYLPSNGLILLI